MTARCRHRDTWLLGTSGEWCWRCGAYRGLKPTGPASAVARTRWVRPVGHYGKNPWRRSVELKPKKEA